MTDETSPALHTVDRGGRRHYCGPTAIAAITGQSFDAIYKKIRRVRSDKMAKAYGYRVKDAGRDASGRRKPIRGMSNGDTLKTLERFGFKVKRSSVENGLTLRAFCEDQGHLGPILVNVTNHYVVVSRGFICDTLTKGKPVPISDYPKLKCRVEKWWLLAA